MGCHTKVIGLAPYGTLRNNSILKPDRTILYVSLNRTEPNRIIVSFSDPDTCIYVLGV
jgi:hypothetical protein